jgi:CDP-6-deoxy-D-xylo-4-hexulose-3-dehydrase
MSTIEGGFVCTNDEEIYHTILQLRSHGWDRDLPEEKQIELQNKWGIDKFNSLYTFYIPGFNFRSTDLQAKIGLSQLERVDDMIETRYQNFLIYEKNLSNKIWFPKIVKNSYTSNFAIPLIFESMEKKFNVIKKFENIIECRPLISGSMGIQPFYKQVFGELKLPNVSLVDSFGMYVPNHPKLTKKEIELICDIVLNTK